MPPYTFITLAPLQTKPERMELLFQNYPSPVSFLSSHILFWASMTSKSIQHREFASRVRERMGFGDEDLESFARDFEHPDKP